MLGLDLCRAGPIPDSLAIGLWGSHLHRRQKLDIRFDSTAFTVHYLDSSGLSYDGTHIDPLYNQWVERLEDAVVALSSVPATAARR